MRDELLSQGAFYGMSRAATAKRADELLDSLELGPLANRGVMGLSGGQKRRLDIALGLIHSPSCSSWTSRRPASTRRAGRTCGSTSSDLREQHGTTIFVTTHYLEEADQYAERVMVMDHGRVIADDTAHALKTHLTGDVITLGFESEAQARRVPNAVVDGTTATLTVPDGERLLPKLIRELDGVRSPRRCVSRPLDDVFLGLTGRSSVTEAGH